MSTLMVIAYVVLGVSFFGVLMFGVLSLCWSLTAARISAANRHIAHEVHRARRGTDQQPPTSRE